MQNGLFFLSYPAALLPIQRKIVLLATRSVEVFGAETRMQLVCFVLDLVFSSLLRQPHFQLTTLSASLLPSDFRVREEQSREFYFFSLFACDKRSLHAPPTSNSRKPGKSGQSKVKARQSCSVLLLLSSMQAFSQSCFTVEAEAFRLGF